MTLPDDSRAYWQALGDAWADMRPWIESSFSAEVKNAPIPNRRGSYRSNAIHDGWNDVTVDLQDLRIARLDGVRAAALEGTNSEVTFPISFEVLELHGRYRMHLEPVPVLMSRVVRHPFDVDKTIDKTIAPGRIAYHASVGPPLTLNRVSLSPAPALSRRGLEAYLEGIVPDFFSDGGFAHAFGAVFNAKMEA